MSTKHTPGPWEAIIIKPSKRDQVGTAMVRAGGSLAIECSHSGDTFAESAANARLIAAAPEMLAALKIVSNYNISPSPSPGVLRLVDAAIAKAEGTQ